MANNWMATTRWLPIDDTVEIAGGAAMDYYAWCFRECARLWRHRYRCRVVSDGIKCCIERPADDLVEVPEAEAVTVDRVGIKGYAKAETVQEWGEE